MKRLAFAALITLPIVMGACSSPSAQPAGPTVLDATDEPLQPGDVVRVTFSEERQLNGDFPVDETYSAALPLLGRVDVRDQGGSALRDSLVQAYEGQVRNQSVQVVVLRRVRVLGEVREPGLYHLDPTMSTIDAIALAGGASSQGQLDGVEILRDGRVVASGLNEEDLLGSYVRSGDQIMVPRTSWLSRNAAWVVGGTVTSAAIIIAALLNG